MLQLYQKQSERCNVLLHCKGQVGAAMLPTTALQAPLTITSAEKELNRASNPPTALPTPDTGSVDRQLRALQAVLIIRPAAEAGLNTHVMLTQTLRHLRTGTIDITYANITSTLIVITSIGRILTRKNSYGHNT